MRRQKVKFGMRRKEKNRSRMQRAVVGALIGVALLTLTAAGTAPKPTPVHLSSDDARLADVVHRFRF